MRIMTISPAVLDEGAVRQFRSAPRTIDRKRVLAIDLPARVLVAKHREAEARSLARLMFFDGAEHAGTAVARLARLPAVGVLGDDRGHPGPTPRALAHVLYRVIVL